jgi:pimeloyl-ACP methyl ester carboxylesterase
MSLPQEDQTLRFVLVHGTWGRGFCAKRLEQPRLIPCLNKPPCPTETEPERWKRLRWYEPGSRFHDDLSKALRERGIGFSSNMFLWDGSNSVLVRNDAAVALAQHLAAISRENPSDPIVLVAHSHGGNVALRAIHVAGEDVAKNVKLITLATPFVQIFTNTSFSKGGILSDPPVNGHVLSLMHVSFLLYIIVATLAVVAVALRHAPLHVRDVLAGVLLISMLTVFSFSNRLSKACLKLIVNPYVAYPNNQVRPDDDLNEWGYKPDRLANSTYYRPPNRERWLLVLRGVDDEASLSLAVGAFGNRVTNYLLQIVLPSGMDFLFAIGGFLLSIPLLSGLWQELVWAALLLLTASLMWLPGVFRRVFGKELLFGAWRCEVSSNSVPDLVQGVEIVTFQHRPRDISTGLRHYLHGHPDVIPKIVEWLTSVRQGNLNEIS